MEKVVNDTFEEGIAAQPKKVRRPVPTFSIGETAANLSVERINEVAYGDDLDFKDGLA